ncbi:Protein of unknown function, partial [Gryllus bimaculatus]
MRRPRGDSARCGASKAAGAHARELIDNARSLTDGVPDVAVFCGAGLTSASHAGLASTQANHSRVAFWRTDTLRRWTCPAACASPARCASLVGILRRRLRCDDARRDACSTRGADDCRRDADRWQAACAQLHPQALLRRAPAAPEDVFGLTPLHYAALGGHEAAAR